MSASQHQVRPPLPVPSEVSMRDLLASCAAATAVSTPPRAPEPRPRHHAEDHREAA